MIGLNCQTGNRGNRPSIALLATYNGPFLFGASLRMADAMFAPVVTRFLTYDVKLDSDCAAYCKAVMAMPTMQEWVDAAKAEPDEMVELDVEF